MNDLRLELLEAYGELCNQVHEVTSLENKRNYEANQVSHI
jgi:hypothetical protein